MKPEDVNFPVTIEGTSGSNEYKIKFKNETRWKKCCNIKGISGEYSLREKPELIKGFKLKTKDTGFEWEGDFRICSRCGEVKYFSGDIDVERVQEAWLKTLKGGR